LGQPKARNIMPGAAIDGVITIVARQVIIAVATHQVVIPASAEQLVIAVIAKQDVPAATTVNSIVATVARELVGIAVALRDEMLASPNRVIEGRAANTQRLNAFERVDAPTWVVDQTHFTSADVPAIEVYRLRHAVEPVADEVDAFAAVHRITAGIASQIVIVRAAFQKVVAIPTTKNVLARTAAKNVGTVTRLQAKAGVEPAYQNVVAFTAV
jgi:hypothetical protein